MAANIIYADFRKNFPDKATHTAAELYDSIGHHDKAINPNWRDSCGLRVSLALVAVHVVISPGFLTIKAGKYKGRRIETRQKVLSAFLVKIWGAPEIFIGGDAARKGMRGRHGVVSFFKLYGPTDTQGHIDLVGPDMYNDATCVDACYWQSVEIWFWPLT